MRTWARRSAVLAAALGLALVVLLARNFVLCSAELAPVTDPGSWASWPVLPGLGPFTLTYEREPCVGHHTQCGFAATELRAPRVCPRCGVSLDEWFGPRGIYASTDEIEVREHGTTYVVVARTNPSAPGTTIAAFERKDGFRRPALAGRTTEAFFLALALGVLGLGAGLALRLERRARVLEDCTRYRPATIEAGRIVLDDDAESYVLSDARMAPGRVLLRARPRAAADYRTTRSVDPDDVVRRDPSTVRQVAAVHAADVRRTAFVIAVMCATVAGVEAAGTWVHDSHVLDLD